MPSARCIHGGRDATKTPASSEAGGLVPEGRLAFGEGKQTIRSAQNAGVRNRFPSLAKKSWPSASRAFEGKGCGGQGPDLARSRSRSRGRIGDRRVRQFT